MDFFTVFFVLPTASSYSTRVNVIFFYMTWTTLVLSHTALRVELFGTLLARLLFYFLPSVLFFILDIAAPGTSASFKERGESGLPTGSKRNKPTLKELKIVGWATLNFGLGIAVQMTIEAFLITTPKLQPAVQMTLSVPMPWSITNQLAWGFLVREILSYTIHRHILHSKIPIFSMIAKAHRTWHHGLRAAFPLTGHYDHPLVYILSTFLPMYVPVLFFRFHMITFLIYTVIISIEETCAFSGYYVLPGVWMNWIARCVESHLASGGKSHFGRWGIVDLLVGAGWYGGAGDGQGGVPGWGERVESPSSSSRGRGGKRR
ncbi:hypothetical protein BJX76DRAFT_355471 [Aspergillus varians]